MIDLFGGTTENLSISLEKSQYSTGEMVKGRLIISASKDIKARCFRFFAEGIEETKIRVRESYTDYYSGGNSYRNNRTVTYTESDTFFSQDLFHFIGSNSNSIIVNSDEDQLIISKGTREIPFEFLLPSKLIPSYSGRNAWISYAINATIDKKLRNDVNGSTPFDVTNAKGTISSPNAIVFSSNRNNDLNIKLELERATYNIGETIRGAVTLKEIDSRDIRGVNVMLLEIERASAHGSTETTIINQHKQEVPNPKMNEPMPFEMNIPEWVFKSYRGRYSELYWEIKATVDIPMGLDLYTAIRVEII